MDLLKRSTLAARRPVNDPKCISAMLRHANLLCTAWDGEKPVGEARSVTDFEQAIVIQMFPPSFQDGFYFATIPDTLCLANFQLSLRDEGGMIAPGRSSSRCDFFSTKFLSGRIFRKSMNFEKEIEQIKSRLNRIETYLSEVTGGAATAPSKSAVQYDLVNFEVKKSQSIIGPEYAFKLTVQNKSETSIRFTGKIIFLDNNEFEVESQVIDVFTVAAGTTFTKTGKAVVVDKNHAPRIADVTAEVYPI